MTILLSGNAGTAAPVSANGRVAKAAPVTPHAAASSVALHNKQPDEPPFSLGSVLAEDTQPEPHTYGSLTAQDTEAPPNDDTLVEETQGIHAEQTSELFAGAGIAELARVSATLGLHFTETQYRASDTAIDLNATQLALSNALAETLIDEQVTSLLAPDAALAFVTPDHKIDIAGKLETLPAIEKMTVLAGELKTDLNETTAALWQAEQLSVSESTVATSLPQVSLTAELTTVPQRPSADLNAAQIVTVVSLAGSRPFHAEGVKAVMFSGNAMAEIPVSTMAEPVMPKLAADSLQANVSLLKHPLGLADNIGLQQFISQQAILSTAVSINPLLAAQTGVASPTTALPQWQGLKLTEAPATWGPKLLPVLSDKVLLQLGQQVQRAQIRLDPPQLGNIELRIAVEGEKTTVQLFAANAQVREAMQHTLELLRLNLGQQLGASAQIDVQVGDQAQQQGAFFADEIAINQQPDVIENEPLQAPGQQQQLGWLNRFA